MSIVQWNKRPSSETRHGVFRQPCSYNRCVRTYNTSKIHADGSENAEIVQVHGNNYKSDISSGRCRLDIIQNSSSIVQDVFRIPGIEAGVEYKYRMSAFGLNSELCIGADRLQYGQVPDLTPQQQRYMLHISIQLLRTVVWYKSSVCAVESHVS